MAQLFKHRYFAFALAIMLVTLPLVLIILQQQQIIRGSAQASTSLFFAPPSSVTSPIIKRPGETFYLDLMLNPGENLVSLIKLEITYDPTKLTPSAIDPLLVNQTVFPEILEGPVYSSGKIQMVLSVGSDFSKAISTQSRVATLNFDSLSTTSETLVDFGPNISVSSVATNDPSGENVLSSTSPAYIKITKSKGGGGSGGSNNPGKGKGPK